MNLTVLKDLSPLRRVSVLQMIGIREPMLCVSDYIHIAPTGLRREISDFL